MTALQGTELNLASVTYLILGEVLSVVLLLFIRLDRQVVSAHQAEAFIGHCHQIVLVRLRLVHSQFEYSVSELEVRHLLLLDRIDGDLLFEAS